MGGGDLALSVGVCGYSWPTALTGTSTEEIAPELQEEDPRGLVEPAGSPPIAGQTSGGDSPRKPGGTAGPPRPGINAETEVR